MSYTPNNQALFIAVYSSAVAGMGVSLRFITDDNEDRYEDVSQVAGAFAIAFDTAWGANPNTTLDFELAQQAVQALWEQRAVQATDQFLNPATYTEEAEAIIAVLGAANSYFSGQGISPNLPSAGGAVIFDGGVISQNARTNRALNQSPINNTKNGIVNLGSDTVGVFGVTANYASILGGDQCNATADYACSMGENATAAGPHAIAFGQQCLANNDNACAFGFQTIASGQFSFAVGQLNTSSGIASFTAGGSNTASGNAATCFGTACTASGNQSFAEGVSCIASGIESYAGNHASTASGFGSRAVNNSIATGDFSSAENASTANGEYSHSEGLGTSTGVGASESHAEGLGTVADGVGSHSECIGSHALRNGQSSHASRRGDPGEYQTSRLGLFGSTTGSGPNETIELGYDDPIGPSQFILEPNKSYTVVVTATAGESVGPTSSALIRKANVRTDALGVVTVTGSSLLEQIGDGIWDLTITAGVGPDRLVITFDTLLTTVVANVAADVKFVEVILP